MLTLFLPFLFGGSQGHFLYWGTTIYEFWAGTCYVGVLPLILAALALLHFRRSGGGPERRRKFLALYAIALLLFGWVMASGGHTPVYEFLHDHLPLFRHTRWPSKFLLWIPYGLALLGGLGFQALGDFAQTLRLHSRRLAAASGLIFLLPAAGYLLARAHPAFFQWLAGPKFTLARPQIDGLLADFSLALVFLAASLALVWLRILRPHEARWLDPAAVVLLFLNLAAVTRQIQPVMSDSIWQGQPALVQNRPVQQLPGRVASVYAISQFQLYGTRDEDVLKSARNAGVGDSWLPFGVHQVWQSGPTALARWRKFMEQPDQGRFGDMAGVRWLIYDQRLPQDLFRAGTKYVFPETGANLTAFEYTNAMPRARLVSRWVQKTAPGEILSAMTSASFDPTAEAIVEPVATRGLAGVDQAAPVPPSNPGAPKSPPGAVGRLDDQNNSVMLEADVKQKSLLILADTWYPGWGARVDGAETPVYRVNWLFRGVFLNPGAHNVLFTYQPWQYFRCVWSTLVTALLLIFIYFRAGVAQIDGGPQQFRPGDFSL